MSFNKKTPQRTLAKMTYILFCVHWFSEHAPKSSKYRFTRFGRLTGRDPKEGTKFILRLLFLTRRWVLIKYQRALHYREYWRKWLIFDCGCTGWQTTPKKLLNINLSKFVGWFQETLRSEQNYFEVLLCNSNTSFQKKKESNTKRRKRAKMFYIWFLVHQLPE